MIVLISKCLQAIVISRGKSISRPAKTYFNFVKLLVIISLALCIKKALVKNSNKIENFKRLKIKISLGRKNLKTANADFFLCERTSQKNKGILFLE